MSLTVRSGGMVKFDPSDKRVIDFDWDAEGLAVGVSISSSTYTITPKRQAVGTAALTKVTDGTRADNRTTYIKLDATAATNGDVYEVANKIVTNENPTQEIEQSYRVLIQN